MYVGGISVIYIITQILTASPHSNLTLSLLFLLLVLISVFQRTPDLLSILFPFLMAQHSFTKGYHPAPNWISSSFILPVSLVQVITVLLMVVFIFRTLQDRELRLNNTQFLFLVLILTGISSSSGTSLTEFRTDFILMCTVVVYMFYVRNAQTKHEVDFAISLFFLVPLGLAVGNFFTLLMDLMLGTDIFNSYWVIHWYIFAVLIGMSFEELEFQLFVKNTYIMIATLHLFVFFFALQDARTGTGKLLIAIAVFTLGGLKHYKIGSENKIWKYVGLTLAPTSIVVMLIYFHLTSSLPFEYLLGKFFSLFTFDLETIRHSPAIRILEVINIVPMLIERGVVHLLFGAGMGGHFSDVYYPFEQYLHLSPSDYSTKEIQSHNFYHPHTEFGGYLLLKYGLIGLLFFGALGSSLFRVCINSRGLKSVIALVALVQLPLFGFAIKNSIVLGIALGLLLRLNTDENESTDEPQSEKTTTKSKG